MGLVVRSELAASPKWMPGPLETHGDVRAKIVDRAVKYKILTLKKKTLGTDGLKRFLILHSAGQGASREKRQRCVVC